MRSVAPVAGRTPHDTHHTVEDDWPLTLGIDERGQSVHVCAACGAEVPDGACAERDGTGVVAWTIAGSSYDESGAIVHDRNVVHRCG